MELDCRSSVRVADLLDDSQLCHIVKKWTGEGSWQLVGAELKPAIDGIAGFLADYFRLTLRVSLEGQLVTIPLFVKSLPLHNAQKVEFIKQHNFGRKEMAIFKLIDEMETKYENPFVAKAFLYNESIVVMRDLATEGYTTQNQIETFDLPHVLVALASVARFHASFANHKTRKCLALQRPYSILEEYHDITIESTYVDTPAMRNSAKLSANIIKHFSDKYRDAIPNLEAQLLLQLLAGCGDLVENEDTLNVVLHKDLWVSNIMFKYENGVPINTILVDFQCARYGPPAFDVMFFLYLTTSRSFRQEHETAVVRHYFKIFTESLDGDTKLRLERLGYDYADFLRWIEFSRKFGMVAAIFQGPLKMMDPETMRLTFDDYSPKDRSESALAYAQRCAQYKRKLLEVNEEFVERSSVRVADLLDDSQLCHIVKKWTGEGSWQLVGAELKPAIDGIAGFLADYFRLTLRVSLEGQLVTIPLFVKSLPLNNAQKAEFVKQRNFGRKEMAIFKLIDEMETKYENPFVAKAFLYNESIVVMRDLATEGYTTQNQIETFDLPHVLVALASVARFHASFANHETRKCLALQRPYSILEEYHDITIESTYVDTPAMRNSAKLSANIIKHFSDKYRDAIPNLEAQLLLQLLAGCGDLVENENTLNVVLHKDLWVSNIMFKYENGVPINTILVDFQCARYGPPAFDVMFFLYLTTSRNFRQEHETAVVRHYFKIFTESLDGDTKLRLERLGYDYADFLRWIEFSRKFGMVAAIFQGPLMMMDPETLRLTFDDYSPKDRSESALAYAQRCAQYKRKLLEVNEEFVERYLLP